MAQNKLIALGCSYTEHYLHSMHAMGVDHSFTRWPQLLADKLDMECVNLGRSGMGNEYIVAKLMDAVLQKNIGLVVIMWSEWQRMDFQIKPDRWHPLHPHRKNERVEKFPMNEEGRKTLLEYYNPVAATMKNLRQFFVAQELIKDIPYLMIQGVDPLCDAMYLFPDDINNRWYTDANGSHMHRWHIIEKIKKKAIKQIIKSPISDRINEDNFIGWPIFHHIGGACVDYMLDNFDPERKIYRVSPNDTHPNGPGHEVISEEIYKAYKKVYG